MDKTDKIVGLSIILFYFLVGMYFLYTISLWLILLMIVILVFAILLRIYINKKRKLREKIRRKEYLSFLHNRVYEEIKRFEPSKNYENEIGYHAELQGWLKRIFPQSKIEMQIGSARPDIVIDNIAIEVKGPTDARALDTLANKCLRYSVHYESMIIVLFNPTVSKKYYDDITDGIKKHFPNVRVIVK